MAPDRLLHWSSNATETVIDYTKNDLLLGFQDPFFWFLVPLFGMVGVGICVAVNYALLAITTLLAAIYSVSSVALHKDEQRCVRDDLAQARPADVELRRLPALLATLSLRSRVLVTGLTILLVSTCIPYHLAYVILCVVQLSTSVRGLSSDMETVCISGVGVYWLQRELIPSTAFSFQL